MASEVNDMQENHWKEIWEKRCTDVEDWSKLTRRDAFVELKRIDGFDVADGGIPYGSLMKQYDDIKDNLNLRGGIQLLKRAADRARIYICSKATTLILVDLTIQAN